MKICVFILKTSHPFNKLSYWTLHQVIDFLVVDTFVY